MEVGSKNEKKTEDGGQNVDLPLEIIDAIVSRLPVKPLCRFKLVSKSWQSLISDPDLVANYSKAAFENEDVFFSRRHLFFGSRRRLYSLNLDQFLNENDHNVDGLVAAAPAALNYVYNGAAHSRDPFILFSCYGLFLCKVYPALSDDIRLGAFRNSLCVTFNPIFSFGIYVESLPSVLMTKNNVIAGSEDGRYGPSPLSNILDIKLLISL